MKDGRMEMVVVLLALAAASALSSACSRPPAPQRYEVLGPDLEPFRTAFNTASRDVRAVLLVGPT